MNGFRNICFFLFFVWALVLISRAQKNVFKITVVIDAVSETDFEDNADIVKEAAEKIFRQREPKYFSIDDNDDESNEEEEETKKENRLQLIYEIVKALPEQSNVQSAIDRDQNPLRVTSKKVCSEIMNGSVAVVLVHSPNDKSLASAISYALGFYEVPVISIASRDIEFSDKSVHSTFLRTAPPWQQQAEVWVSLLEKLDYQKVILMYPDESNAAALVASFRELIDNRKIQIDSSIMYRARHVSNDDSYFDKIVESDCNIVLIYASPEDAYDIFRQYNKRLVGSTRARVLIANEMALQANNTPSGLLAVSLKATHELRMHLSSAATVQKTFLRESLWTLKHGILNWYQWIKEENVTMQSPPKCDSVSSTSPSKDTQWAEVLGPKLYNVLLATHYLRRKERTLVAFDNGGDRKGAPYVIVNIQTRSWSGLPLSHVVGSVVVGEYFYKEGENAMVLTLNESAIVWGSNVTEKPKDFTLKTHLIVGTVSDPPFIYVDNITDPSQCHLRKKGGPWRTCSKTDVSTGQMNYYCCRGLCVELLDQLANNNYTTFTYEIRLSKDGQYGARQPDSKWTGLVGELISEEIDMAVAALTINPERDYVIDFSKPWLYHGITILEKQKKRRSPMESFMQPFQWQLWICIFLSVLVIGIIMFGLDKLSPFGRFYVHRRNSMEPLGEDEEHPLGFSGAMWFVWGVLLDSGIGERTPRSLSARVLGMVWCGFSMIMVASYTANLAAFLVLDQPQKSLTGITDTRLRNPNPNYTFATVKNSNVHMFFKRHVELSTIYRTMEGKNYEKAKDAVADLKNDKLDAFIWDSTYLEFIAASDCELQTSGELFGRAGYGIGLQKGSHWTSIITLAILHAHESGYMQQLDAKYITGVDPPACKLDDNSPVRLGLTNMRDLFILVAGGIVVGFLFIGFEILYKRRHDSVIRKRQLALHYGRIWRQRSSSKKSTPRRSFDRFTEMTPSDPNLQVSLPPGSWTHTRPLLNKQIPRGGGGVHVHENPQHAQLLPPSRTLSSIVWDRMEGPVQVEISELENDGAYQSPDDGVIDSPDPRYASVPLPQLQHSSPQSQDERLAYRPRRAIIV